MKKKLYGWKGFNINQKGELYCRNKKYTLGEIAEQTGKLEICNNGLHFCWNLANVMDFYNFANSDVVIGKVEILGDVVDNDDKTKSCTNKLKVVRLYKTKKQLMDMSNNGSNNTGYCNTGNCNTGGCNTGNRNTGNRNTGNWNTGDCNTGNRNTGDCNTGDCNTGYCNTGNRNTGNRNTGNRNTGDCNTGDWNTGNCNTGGCNTGNRNTGNRNTGNWNTGDWNSCNFSNGLFNTISPKINLFNKPSNYTMEEFKRTKWYDALTNGIFRLTEWVDWTEEELKEYENRKNSGGRQVPIDFKVACKKWWDTLSDEDREIIQTMPNFDKTIFTDITGIEL